MPDEPDNKSAIKSKTSRSDPEPDPKKVPLRKTKQEPKPEPEPEPAPKKLVAKKKKYEELPEIPDYDRPDLEQYEASDFDPSKYVKTPLEFATRTPEKPAEKPVVTKPNVKQHRQDELEEIPDYERPQLEKFEKTPFEPAAKAAESVEKGLKPKDEAKAEPEVKVEVPKKKTPKAAKDKQFDDFVPGKVFQLKPTSKKPKPKTEEESTEATIGAPAPALKSSEGESADAKLKVKKEKKPSTVEEAASKNIVIKGADVLMDSPEDYEEIVTSAQEAKSGDGGKASPETDSNKSVEKKSETDDSTAKKKARRTKNGALELIPDEADEDKFLEENASIPSPDSQSQAPTRTKYDPLKFIPDKEVDLTSVPVENLDDSNDAEVNKHTHK